jgi:hypothetical protein
MNIMRSYISLYEQFQQEIDEAGAGPSRIVKHIHNGAVFIMLSAMRADIKHSENLRRTDQLARLLSSKPVSFIETEGEYHEEGQTDPSPEKSFFVMPRRGAHRITPDQFRDFGIKLMKRFNQDSILFGDGKMATLIFSNGETMDLGDAVTFRPEIIQNLGGFSKIKGRPFSFTDRPTAGADVGADDESVPSKTRGTIYGQLAAALDKSKDKDKDMAPKKLTV